MDAWKTDFQNFIPSQLQKMGLYELTQRDQKIESNRSRLIVGNPREVYEQMEALRAVSNLTTFIYPTRRFN